MKKRIYKGREVNLNFKKERIIKQTNKLIDKANQRLSKLNKGLDVNKSVYDPKKKRYVRTNKRIDYQTFEFDTWASKKLYSRIDADPGYIEHLTNDEKNMTKIINYNRALKLFLNSQTSTPRGVSEVVKTTKDTIRRYLEDPEDIKKLSDKDVENIYDLFNDNDFKYVTETENVKPSEIWVALKETVFENGDKDTFLRIVDNRLFDKSIYENKDLLDSLETLYENFSYRYR